MLTLIPQHPRTLQIGLRSAVWLAIFLSPTSYFILLLMADNWHLPPPPEGLIVALFCLIPVAALLICGTLVWRSRLTQRWRVGWLAVTVLAMLLQCGALFVLLVASISAAIAPVQ